MMSKSWTAKKTSLMTSPASIHQQKPRNAAASTPPRPPRTMDATTTTCAQLLGTTKIAEMTSRYTRRSIMAARMSAAAAAITPVWSAKAASPAKPGAPASAATTARGEAGSVAAAAVVAPAAAAAAAAATAAVPASAPPAAAVVVAAAPAASAGAVRNTEGAPGAGGTSATYGAYVHAMTLRSVSAQPRAGHRLSHHPAEEKMEALRASRHSAMKWGGMYTIAVTLGRGGEELRGGTEGKAYWKCGEGEGGEGGGLDGE